MLVGREADCARIDELLDRARRGRSGTLVIRGEAGLGKTALLNYAAERAEGFTVVRAVGVEYEAELQFSGLLELVRPLLGHLDEIPAQQAEALRSALGLGEPRPHDRFTICAATLSLLAAAAESNPLLALVDDAQWLDRATSDALIFAVKRLVADAAAVLFAVREGEERTFDAPALEHFELRALGPEEAEELLAAEGCTATPDVVRQLCEATHGNPLALLEVSGALSAEQRAGREPLPDPVPAGPTLERAFAWRTEALPEGSRRALVVAAVSLSDEVETIGAALEAIGVERDALEPAEDAGLVTLVDGRLAFRHPLVRSAVFHAAPPSERRAAHRAVAEALSERNDAERFAWHLAGAAMGFDEMAAIALEAAARQAEERSSYAAAAAAHERAAGLTADEEARPRRLFAAADAALSAGRAEDALSLLAEPVAQEADQALKAAALRLQGRIAYLAGRPREAGTVLVEAARLLEDVDRRLAIEICTEACSAQLGIADPVGVLAAAERAAELAAPLPDDDELHQLVALTRGWVLCYVGRSSEGVPLLEEAVPSATQLDPLGLMRSSGALEWLDRSREAYRVACRDVAQARAKGAVGLLPYLLYQQAWHANRAGLLSDGYACGSEGLALARELDLWLPRTQSLLVLAAITGRRGSEDECLGFADEVRPALDEAGLVGYRVWLRHSLGLLAVGLSDLEGAARELDAAARGLEELGIHSRGIVPRAELAEVHARAGRADDALAALETFEASLETQSQVGLATAARARGLLATDDELEERFDEALALHEGSDDQWALARTQLAFGERLRRSGRRRDAREPLRLALETFEAQGAETWADRVRAELRASGETLRRRKSWEEEQLTPQELQIALHVARGMTNRDVGAALFLSHKTIEFHLGRIYRKLKMQSRAELIRRFAREAEEAEAVPA